MFTVSIEGPAKNALSNDVIDALLGALERARGAPILVTGAGDCFSSGLHLGEVATFDAAAMERFLVKLERLMVAYYKYPAPMVAAINGHAIAGGSVIALCCDWRVCSANPKIKIGLNEVPLGLRFPPNILTIVRKQIPRPHHLEVLLEGRLFDPESAKRVGLIDSVAADVVAAASARLEELAKLPAHVFGALKAELRERGLISEAESAERVRAILPEWTSPDVKRLIAQRLAK